APRPARRSGVRAARGGRGAPVRRTVDARSLPLLTRPAHEQGCLMCDFHAHDHGLPALARDEYLLDTPRVRAFVAGARARIDAADGAAAACEAIRPSFVEL